jgi:hypothetical protein
MKKVLFVVLFAGMIFMLQACVVHDGPGVHQRPQHQEGAGIPARIDNQQQRINQGVASGELTRREADQLQDNLNYIRKDYSRMTADGRLTRGEISRLERLLDQNSEMIQNKKQNAVRRLY